MAVIKCGMCGNQREQSFYEHWNCYDCGADWGISLVEYSTAEFENAFQFLANIRSHFGDTARNGVVVLARDLDSPESSEGESLVDTLLLFFDNVILPDIPIKHIPKLIGENKAALYYDSKLIKSADISSVEALAYGLVTPKRHSSAYDMELTSFDIEEGINVPHMSVRYSLYRVIENFGQVYKRQLLALLSKTHLFNKHRIADSNQILLKGNQYTDGYLAEVIPNRFLRNEIFCYLYGAELISDTYYGIANTFREYHYANVLANKRSEFGMFREWLHSTAFKRAKLDPSAVLDFRSEVGSLGLFIKNLRDEIARNKSSGNSKELTKEFCSEIDKRIVKYKKVKGKSHERKTMYLSGLMSTLGSILGGPIGAVVGGIGGVTASQLCLEYDRKISPEICFIANEVVNDR